MNGEKKLKVFVLWIDVSYKMTTFERFHEMKTTIEESIVADGCVDIHTRLAHLQPTVQDFLKLAYYEKKIEGPIGMCGTSCDGTCATCEHHNSLLDAYFSKKEDELLSLTEAYLCARCDAECVPYEVEEETFWICENCYNDEGNDSCLVGCCEYDHYDEI